MTSARPNVEILVGDAVDRMRDLSSDRFHCVVTSPPYWRLRDYDVEGQIGWEDTIEAYVDSVAGVFDEVGRVMRKDGTLWLNMGDSSFGTEGGSDGVHAGLHRYRAGGRTGHKAGGPRKSLAGAPWRVALEMMRRGWIIRSEIIWEKPSAMPSSAKDRPTCSHETIFLCVRSRDYFYDENAIREPSANPSGPYESRNARTVWRIAPQPYKGSHSATFPVELPTRCLLAGCPKDGEVLDPFGGAGTTGLAAALLGLPSTLIELSQAKAAEAEQRIRSEVGLVAEVSVCRAAERSA